MIIINKEWKITEQSENGCQSNQKAYYPGPQTCPGVPLFVKIQLNEALLPLPGDPTVQNRNI